TLRSSRRFSPSVRCSRTAAQTSLATLRDGSARLSLIVGQHEDLASSGRCLAFGRAHCWRFLRARCARRRTSQSDRRPQPLRGGGSASSTSGHLPRWHRHVSVLLVSCSASAASWRSVPHSSWASCIASVHFRCAVHHAICLSRRRFLDMLPNPALQPTVFAFGKNFPRNAARWLGAAELDR